MFSSLRRRRVLRSHVIGEGVSGEIGFPAVGPSYAVIRDLSSYRLTNFSALWEEGCPDGVHLPSSAIEVGIPMARKALLEFDVPSFTFFEGEDFPATYATDRISHNPAVRPWLKPRRSGPQRYTLGVRLTMLYMSATSYKSP